jgi:AraC family transcriptional regulator of adaptative response / DNA-3-methyladenine glycosylase II
MDHDACYRALSTRDARFDGLFYVGVTTTRIYCRPVCPARTPRREHCRFFGSAAEAERAGFRPCLRCRPELAPGLAPVDAAGRVARAAAARIAAGALNGGGTLDGLAAEFGLGARQLRRVVRRELGVSPVRLAQTHRLLLAKRLLTETRLPVIEVALASGFESLRRFNALFRAHYRLTPSRLRRSPGAGSGSEGEALRLRLSYRPPFAWPELLRALGARAVAGVELVWDGAYLRTAEVGPLRGWLRVAPDPSGAANALAAEFAPALAPALAPLLARLRHLFDLDARPDVIAGHLGGDARIGPAVRLCPGLRVPGAFDGFELAWRAVLGRHAPARVAGAAARAVVAALGGPVETPFPGLDRLTPRPERVAVAGAPGLTRLGVPRDAALGIDGLARAVVDGRLRLEAGADPDATLERLGQIPGVDGRTAQVIAMHALGWPDAFPDGDPGLARGLGLSSVSRLRPAAEGWRPWRAYAAMHVWNGPGAPLARERA